MREQSIASAHIKFSILFAALPLAVCAFISSLVMREQLVHSSREQMQNTINETAEGINAEFASKSCLTAMLVHDRPLMEKSLEYCATKSPAARYDASAQIDAVLERVFRATDLKGSVYLAFTMPAGTQHETYVNRNYQTLNMDKNDVFRITQSVIGEENAYTPSASKVHCVDSVFRWQDTLSSQVVCMLCVRPPRNMGYITEVSAVSVAFASHSLQAFLYGNVSAGATRYIIGRNGKVLASSMGNSGMMWKDIKDDLLSGYIITEQKIDIIEWTICDAVLTHTVSSRAQLVFASPCPYPFCIGNLFRLV